jgi:outer membrane protein insertion porin family
MLVHAADLTGKIIVSVTLVGNVTIPEDRILAVTKLRPGDTFDSLKLQQDVRSIYELGNFFDVSVKSTEVPGGINIVYSVLENRPVTDFVFSGNTKVTADTLQSLVTIKKGSVSNFSLINQSEQAIEQYYRDQGYVLARVSNITLSPEGILTIYINEGMLEGIVAKGNEKTKAYVITREIKLKIGEPFNAKDAKLNM